MSKRKKEESNIQPPVVFRHMLAADLGRAENLLRADPSLLDSHGYGTETSLHFWAVENRPDIVAWLLERGADPDTNCGYAGPLFAAAMLGNTEVCQLLINATADLNQRTANGETLLHAASSHGYLPICALLIQAGADVNAPDICGETPWDQALPRKQKEVRALLEKHGAVPTDPTKDDY